MLDEKIPELTPEDLELIKKELENPLFSAKKHYADGTYTGGCRGILCRRAHRDAFSYKRYLARVAKNAGSVPTFEPVSDREISLTAFTAAMLAAERREQPAYLTHRLNVCGLKMPQTTEQTDPRVAYLIAQTLKMMHGDTYQVA